METNDLFDIQLLDGDELGLPYLSELSAGTVYLTDNGGNLAETAEDINRSILEGLDLSASYGDYSVRAIEAEGDDMDSSGYNVICPLDNPITGEKEYLVAFAERNSLEFVVPSVIDESETLLRGYLRDALILDALSSPDEFAEDVEMIIGSPETPEEQDGKVSYNFMPTSPSPAPEKMSFFGIRGKGDREKLEEKPVGIVPSEDRYLRDLSAKERKALFLKIPEKITASFEKQDPETCRYIDQITDNLTPEEAKALLKLLVKKTRRSAQDLTYAVTGGYSNYELHIVPRPDHTVKQYKDKVRYVMVLKDAKGREIPVVFKNAPSYCIYMMHVIDRVTNKENAKAIDLSKNKAAFKAIYTALFFETEEKIDKYYRELENRPDGDKLRKGRYPEYIKDIHQTFEAILGTVNSMPFKIGKNQYLSLIPAKIKIPSTLLNITSLSY